MKNDELLSKTITCLRFPLSVGVVFIHFYFLNDGIRSAGIRYQLDYPEWFRIIQDFFSQVLPRIAVPMFFLISGFLFFHHTDFNKQAYLKKLKSRARTLLLPYFVWNTLFLLYTLSILVKQMLPSLFPRAHEVLVNVTPSAILNAFWIYREKVIVDPLFPPDLTKEFYPIDVPFWFVRDLIVMVIVSPLLFWLIKRGRHYFVFLLGMAWFCLHHVVSGHPVMLLTAAFFFSAGAYFSIHGKDLIGLCRRVSFIPYVYVAIAVADVLTKDSTCNPYIHNAGILTGICSAFLVVSRLLEKGKLAPRPFLADSSFFLFALHTLTMGIVVKLLATVLLPATLSLQLLFYFAVPVLNICLCLLLYRLLRRFLPGVLGLLTGGR